MIAVKFLISYLTASSDKDIDEYSMSRRECFILKYNKTYELVGIISIFVGVIFLILAWTGIGKINTEGDIIAVAIVVLLPSILGILIVLCAHNIKIEVSNDKIKYCNLFNIGKEIFWDDIKEVECSSNLLEIKFKPDKRNIKVHRNMPGYAVLEMRMEKKLNKSINEKTLNKIYKQNL
jgi:hypothetical protein